MNWPLYRSLHARGITQAKLATLTGINRSVLCRIMANEHGRGKESREKIFPHLVTAEIQALGWWAEYATWWHKTTGQPLPMEQNSTANIVPSYGEWLKKLREIAKEKGFAWLIPPNPDYESIYQDGATPEKALDDEIEAARSSC